MRPYKTGIETEELLRLLRETEITGKELARKFGCTPSNITNRVRLALGMTPTEYRKQYGWRGGQRGLSPREVQQVLIARRAGATKSSLERSFGVGRKSILEVIGPGRDQSPPTGLNLPGALIAQRYRDGGTTVALASEFEISEREVRRVLDAQGVERRGHASRAGRARAKARR